MKYSTYALFAAVGLAALSSGCSTAEQSTSQTTHEQRAFADFPDTPASRLAADFVAEYSSDVMVRHVKRSYLFAAAMAEAEQKAFDAELVYVAMMLHDLGLEEPFDRAGDFETNGADAASAFLASHGFDTLAQDVSEAIKLHTDQTTAMHERYEYALVSRGALADVVGAGLDKIPAETVSAIIAAYPRWGTKDLLIAQLEGQAKTKPNSRIGQTFSRVPVATLIQNAPFEE